MSGKSKSTPPSRAESKTEKEPSSASGVSEKKQTKTNTEQKPAQGSDQKLKQEPDTKKPAAKKPAAKKPNAKKPAAKKPKQKAAAKKSAAKKPKQKPGAKKDQVDAAVIQHIREEKAASAVADAGAIDQALEVLRQDISTSTLPDPDIVPKDESEDAFDALGAGDEPPMRGFFGVLDRAQNAMTAAEERLIAEADEPPKSYRKLQVALIIGGLIVLLIAGAFTWYQVYGRVAVPDLVGMSQTDAVSALNKKHLKVGQLLEKESVDVEPGTVVDQSPMVDVKVARGSAVDLTTAKASDQVAVPSVLNKTLTDANATLVQSRLIYQEAKTFSDVVPPGQIVGQLPVAGTTVDSGSQVTVLISQGSMRSPIPVPKVMGLSKADATKLLSDQGFIPLFYFAQTTFGNVNEAVTQTPASTGVAMPGSVVMVLISQGNSASGMIVPDVAGKDEAAAVKALRDAGFNVDVRHIVTSSAAAGKVVAQTPQSNDTHLDAGATVGILVSAGTNPLVKVPSLLGTQLATAQDKLRSIGLTPWVVPLPAGQHAGVVTQQFPAGAQDYQLGLPVLLYAPPAQNQTSGSAP
ncbi:MAG: PASTA domain-containing protein [Coriobacteriia bacterium]|nr:PASTA domain-containing protein [Coriobacteriia bacterium]